MISNLPGTETYDCWRPWLYKKTNDGFIVANLFVYVDDGQPIGTTEAL